MTINVAARHAPSRVDRTNAGEKTPRDRGSWGDLRGTKSIPSLVRAWFHRESTRGSTDNAFLAPPCPDERNDGALPADSRRFGILRGDIYRGPSAIFEPRVAESDRDTYLASEASPEVTSSMASADGSPSDVDKESNTQRIRTPSSLEEWAKHSQEGAAAGWVDYDSRDCLNTVRHSLRGQRVQKSAVRTCLTSPFLINDLKIQFCNSRIDKVERLERMEEYIGMMDWALSKGAVSADDVLGALFGVGGVAHRSAPMGNAVRRFARSISGRPTESALDSLKTESIVKVWTLEERNPLTSEERKFFVSSSAEIHLTASVATKFANLAKAALKGKSSWRAESLVELGGYGEDGATSMVNWLRQPAVETGARVFVREMLKDALGWLVSTQAGETKVEPRTLEQHELSERFRRILEARQREFQATPAAAQTPLQPNVNDRTHGADQQKSFGARIRSAFQRVVDFFKHALGRTSE